MNDNKTLKTQVSWRDEYFPDDSPNRKSVPTIKGLFEYLSYQYPNCDGDILLKKFCELLAHNNPRHIERELAELRKDKERLDWYHHFLTSQSEYTLLFCSQFYTDIRRLGVRAAIDAAMKGEKR